MGRIAEYPVVPRTRLIDNANVMISYPSPSSDLGSCMTDYDIYDTGVCCPCAFRAMRLDHMECLKALPREVLMEADEQGRNVLHLAVKCGNSKMIDYLVSEVEELIDMKSTTMQTPLHFAAASGNVAAMERLLDAPPDIAFDRALQQDETGATCLMITVANSDNDAALFLLRRFGRELVVLPNNENMLPIHLAAANGNTEFIRLAAKYDQRTANARDQYGCTPCIYAAQCGSLPSLQYLVQKLKADIATLTNKGQSVLHVASLSGHTPIVRWFLCRTGLDAVLWTTYDRANAIHCAAFGGHVTVAKVLLDLWPKKRRKALLSTMDARGNSPLHLATINNNLDMIKYLLECGVDPEAINATGQTAEQIALRRGYTPAAELIAKYSKNKKNRKSKNQSQSCSNLATSMTPTPPLIFGSHAPTNNDTCSTRCFSGYDNNSYASGMENYNPLTVETSTQTDSTSSLKENQATLFHSEKWQDEALAAVEEIDRILEGMDK